MKKEQTTLLRSLTQMATSPVVLGWLETARAIEQSLQTLAEIAIPSLEALARIDWVAAKQRLDELPEKSRAAMEIAASKGWFFGWNDSLQSLTKLIETLHGTSPEGIDAVMVDYYRANLQPFADELASRYPNRAVVIKAAVNAHTLGNDGYFLSVPVFIAQADGLLTEITKVTSALMKDAPRKPELQASRALRERLGPNHESMALVHQLLNLHNLDFLKSARARQIAERDSGESFTALNRHQVMHGESWDYGTEVNSLRAFSFLMNVGAHLPAILEYK
jgi:hypothetical protein